eukprot:1158933-Pelagomonas_calceolata.AAC.6
MRTDAWAVWQKILRMQGPAGNSDGTGPAVNSDSARTCKTYRIFDSAGPCSTFLQAACQNKKARCVGFNLSCEIYQRPTVDLQEVKSSKSRDHVL